MRQRAELLSPVQQTTPQYHLPEIGQKIADKAHREGVAERFPEPAVQKSIAVDLALIDYYAPWLTNLALDLVQTATAHEAQTCYRWRSIPGGGTIPALVRRCESHARPRFPRVQEFVSYGRLVQCAKEAAGTREGPSGKKIGTADRKGAFADAAVRFLPNKPAGQRDLARLEKTQSKGKALTVLAHTVARAAYDMGQRATAFALDKVCHGSWSGVRAPAASRAAAGIGLASEC